MSGTSGTFRVSGKWVCCHQVGAWRGQVTGVSTVTGAGGCPGPTTVGTGAGTEVLALLKLHWRSCRLHGPCCRWELGTAHARELLLLPQRARDAVPQALWGCGSGVAALPTVLSRGLCVFPDAHLQTDRRE